MVRKTYSIIIIISLISNSTNLFPDLKRSNVHFESNQITTLDQNWLQTILDNLNDVYFEGKYHWIALMYK